MIDIALLDDLLHRMQAAGLAELDVQQGQTRIAMRLGAVPAVAPVTKAVAVHAEGIGVFRASHPRRPGEELQPGASVSRGTVLGYCETDFTLTAIAAPVAGTLSQVLASDGKLLGYGTHVFTVEHSE